MPSSVARAPAATAVDCPSDDALFALLPGGSSGEEGSSISAHVLSCSACQSRLTTLGKQAVGGGSPSTSLESRATPEPAGSDDPAAKRVAKAEGSPSDRTTTLLEMRPRAPRQIGQYELLRLIGRGGMGLVYLARHVRLGREFAVKLLPGLHLSDRSAVIRLQRETAAAGRVGHPNVVYATDAGESDGIDYLVMEYVDGADLSKLVTALGPLSVADACEIARQAALGLAHIADCGLVHRDIKPSNLMLARDGTVKILDLGLARLREGKFDDREATHSGFLLGTADYVSPEQADRPQSADIRSDLYSLGCTLFKLLAGRAPFDDESHSSFAAKIEAHRSAAPPNLAELREGVPEEVVAILGRLLTKRAHERYASPAELAAALLPLVEGAALPALITRLREQGALSDPPPLPTPSPKPATNSTATRQSEVTPKAVVPAARHRAPAAVLAVTGLLLVGGILASILPQPSSPPDGTRVYDVSEPLPPVIWIGHLPSPPPYFALDRQMLELRPDSFQLLELGRYDGTPGTFSVTISQSPWYGGAGLFFGCRSEPKFDRPALTTFQLFTVDYFPGATARQPDPQELFRVSRQRGSIYFDPVHLRREARTIEVLPTPRTREVLLEITFGADECLEVRANGIVLGRHGGPAANAEFRPEDYRGTFGIYCEPGYAPRSRTWFSNIEFTPLEK